MLSGCAGMTKRIIGVVLAVWTLWRPAGAAAGGVEFPAAGTNVLGRGGAGLARPGDGMALLYNPANLAAESGLQLSLQTHVAFYDACFQRDGTYLRHGETPDYEMNGPDPAREPGSRVQSGDEFNPSAFNDDISGIPDRAMPRVCNSGPPSVIPELILSWRVHEMLGVAIGFVAPAGIGHTKWGGSQRVGDRRYHGIVDGLPAPSRYNLVESQLLLAFPMLGVGFAPHPRFRIGASFGSGFARVRFENVTRARRGEDFANDIYTTLNATDSFVPRVVLSAHVVPHDNLDIMASFTWTDAIDAQGKIRLESGYYRDEILQTLDIPNSRLVAPAPWQVAFGIRYADRVAPRPVDARAVSRLSGRVEDPMSNERFDIELDVVYERNSNVDAFRTTLGSNPDSADGLWDILIDTGIPTPVPPTSNLAHQWKDSLSVRLGGDYNVMPGLAAVRLGFSFETKGVEDGYEQLDFLPFMRFGAHLGLTLRLGRFDVSLAYAHIQQVATTVSPADARITQVSADARYGELCTEGTCLRGYPPSTGPSNFGQGTVVNTGRYTSNFDIVSLGLTYHFQ